MQEEFYSNRTDFIRTAIRNQLATQAEAVTQSIVRHTLELGFRDYSRADLEAVKAAGEKLTYQSGRACAHRVRCYARARARDNRIDYRARRLAGQRRSEVGSRRPHSDRARPSTRINFMNHDFAAAMRRALQSHARRRCRWRDARHPRRPLGRGAAEELTIPSPDEIAAPRLPQPRHRTTKDTDRSRSIFVRRQWSRRPPRPPRHPSRRVRREGDSGAASPDRARADLSARCSPPSRRQRRTGALDSRRPRPKGAARRRQSRKVRGSSPVILLRGRNAKLQALHSRVRDRSSARSRRHAAWLQAGSGRFRRRHKHECSGRGPRRLLVAYPGQTGSANAIVAAGTGSIPADQMRDAGEPSIIAGIHARIISNSISIGRRSSSRGYRRAGRWRR